MPTATPQFLGTGRRKTSIARVRLRDGRGQILVNGKPIGEYFPEVQQVVHATAPLKAVEALERFDVLVNTHGGGYTGQAGALRMGIARALLVADASLEPVLREGKFLSRDSRMVERKKYGKHKARRGHQFSKR